VEKLSYGGCGVSVVEVGPFRETKLFGVEFVAICLSRYAVNKTLARGMNYALLLTR